MFAGYGIVAAEYGRDDYANLDVHGKTVVELSGDPGAAGCQHCRPVCMSFYPQGMRQCV